MKIEIDVMGMLDKAKVGFINLLSRFPYTMFLITCVFFLSVYLVESETYVENGKNLYTLTMVDFSIALLAIVSLLGYLLHEKGVVTKVSKWVTQLIATVSVSLLSTLFLLPEIMSYDVMEGVFTANAYKFLILFVVSIISIFTLPFLKDKKTDAFWNFLVGAVFAACIGLIYGVVVFAGISVALAAIEAFWKFTFANNQYAIVAIFAFIFVAPINFLRNLPLQIKEQALTVLPDFAFTLIKVVLLPLIVVYSLIIYPYMAGFPFKSEWPNNESTMIIVGLLALVYLGVLLFNGLDKEGVHKKFISLYTRIFSALTLPAIIFWAYSLYLRINAYGLTVNRFFLMTIIFWTFGVGIYYVFFKNNDIKKVIISFIALLVVVFYFPFSSFFWSNRSQQDRFEEITKELNMVVDGKVTQISSSITFAKNEELNEILYYLNTNGGLKSVESSLSDSFKSQIKLNKYGYSALYKYSYSDGLRFSTKVDNNYYESNSRYISISLKNSDELSIEIPSGYTKVRTVNYMPYSKKEDKKVIDKVSNLFRFDSENDSFIPSGGGNNYDVTDPSLLRFHLEDRYIQVLELSGELEIDGKISITYIRGIEFTK